MNPVVLSTWRFGLEANTPAWERLQDGGSALDAVVEGVSLTELDPKVNSVGYGGHPNADGVVEVDAAVMDGRNLGYGAVAGLQNMATPTAVARKVMEDTSHVLLVGEGARSFAKTQGFEERDMLTDKARKGWETWKADQEGLTPESHDTIGMLALDGSGDLAAACTTSGAAYSLPGRVGDSPLIGCGLYADNEIGAAAATGRGEEIARTCGSFSIVEYMRLGHTPQEACEAVVQRLIARVPSSKQYQMAYIAINRSGEYGGASARTGFSFAVTNAAENRLVDARFFLTPD